MWTARGLYDEVGKEISLLDDDALDRAVAQIWRLHAALHWTERTRTHHHALLVYAALRGEQSYRALNRALVA